MRRTWEFIEVMGIEYLKDDNGFKQTSNGGDEKFPDSNYIQKIEPKERPNFLPDQLRV